MWEREKTGLEPDLSYLFCGVSFVGAFYLFLFVVFFVCCFFLFVLFCFFVVFLFVIVSFFFKETLYPCWI